VNPYRTISTRSSAYDIIPGCIAVCSSIINHLHGTYHHSSKISHSLLGLVKVTEYRDDFPVAEPGGRWTVYCIGSRCGPHYSKTNELSIWLGSIEDLFRSGTA